MEINNQQTIRINNSKLNQERYLPENRHYIPKEFKEAASSMEKQFTDHLLKQMDQSISRSQPLSSAQSIYRSMLRDHHSKILAESESGIGIKKVVLDQIYPRKFRNEAQFKNHQAQKTAQAKLAKERMFHNMNIDKNKSDNDEIIIEQSQPSKNTKTQGVLK